MIVGKWWYEVVMKKYFSQSNSDKELYDKCISKEIGLKNECLCIPYLP